MESFRKALKAEPLSLSFTSISTTSPSMSILVSSLAKDSFTPNEIATIHWAIALLSGLWASQDNKFNFICIKYLRNGNASTALCTGMECPNIQLQLVCNLLMGIS